MDSGNTSGSMQSSSGGDEEYDSRPAFLNHPPPSAHFGPQSSFLPTLFDTSPNLFHSFSHHSPPNPNPNLLNPDFARSRGLIGSEPDCTAELGNILTGSSSAASSSQPTVGTRSSALSDQTPHSAAPRNPKKRTRASRRAPTTVLTTDTSNFRAMVQEFTGIPAPPFSGSPYSRRLDLLGAGSLYPLRSSAQKVQQPSHFISSSSSSSSFFNNTMVDATNNNNITASIPSTTSSTFNIPISSVHFQPHQNMMHMQNPMLSLQSLLQPSPIQLSTSLNLPILGTKSQEGGLPLSSLHEELSMSHGGGLLTTEGIRLQRDDGGGSDGGNHQEQLRNIDGIYSSNSSQRLNSSCKLNYSVSSSEFHHDRGLDSVASRGEGTVDSWICPEINEAK